MKAVIDTSSLVSLVRYYMPIDKSGYLFEGIKSKIIEGEILLLDAVYRECEFVSQKIVLKKLNYLENKDFFKEHPVIIKTDELIPLKPKSFLNMVKNQFVANPVQYRKLSEAEFEVQKKHFMESADAKLIMYSQHLIKDNPDEEIYLVTEETSSPNDLKLFKKIPSICSILGIPVITLPDLLLKKYPLMKVEFG